MMIHPKFRMLASSLALAGAFGVAVSVHSGELVIATDPLGTGASSVQPNIMFILDDSGSMASNYMPDTVNDGHNPTGTPATTAGCYDAGDDGGGITGAPDACVFGDPPFNSPDFNTIYYNPALRYNPGLAGDALNTSLEVQNRANTNNWQEVLVDPYQSTAVTNIVTQYQDRVWCANQSDAPTSGTCRQNSGYTFPNSLFPYGRDSGNNVKYVTGSPYYYRMQTRQFCTDVALTSCFSGSAITTAMLPFPAAEFCTDEELRNCAAGAAVTSAHVFYGVRWCTNNTTMTDCQRKKMGAYIHAKHLGVVINGTVNDTAAKGNIRVTSLNLSAGTNRINSITIGGSSVISAAINVPSGSTTSSVAGLIVTAINAGPLAATYTAAQSGADVVVTADATGPGPNGRTIIVASTTNGTVSARGLITVSTAGSSSTITSITVNGQQLLSCAPATSPRTFTVSGNTASWVTGGGTSGALSRIVAPSGTSSNNKRQATRDAIAAAINTCAAVPPGGSGPWTATNNGNYGINLIAPLNLGSAPNGWTLIETGGITTTLCNVGNTGCGGTAGVSSQSVVTTNSPMAGGATAFTGPVRVGTGQFQRTDIVPSVDAYPKSALRTDCAGANCTYEEEMTNFANWYAYHRTRMHMMKGAVGHAFRDVPAGYRVGFITICPIAGACTGASTSGLSVVTAKYLKAAPWDDTQKSNWYAKLYAQNPTGNTPLREALSRVGLMYSGVLGAGLTRGLSVASGDDPVQYSCQPNFAILSTDGYWNGAGGVQIDNSSAMANVDNTNTAPYSLQADGVYDGGTPVASNTLADVALYYYKTDLRPGLTDSVPTTNRDTAGHQHMVTFTIGLGLDGELTFRSDYETADTGDFFDIKQGTKKWPVPIADRPTTLDDLWHAAVNGRGVFFSAKNPEQVAQSLRETLEQLSARVGAGAAAATSNLQPVAGDNFAFTAQYQTSDWIGDLKARTVDLASGTVSGIQLWSAAEILDASLHTSRRIFVYDAGDCGSASVPCVRNRAKHFCMAADFGAAWCNEGGTTNGLSPTEESYFDPSAIALTQEPSWTSGGTTASLVNYLRGDISNYNTGATPRGATDLYRTRASILGDIVNAQPAYVRKSPFAYGDFGYGNFKACAEGGTSITPACPVAQFPDSTRPRRGTVYAASNDGMLHAFETDVNNNPYYQTAGIITSITSDDTFTGNNAGNGVERWAYIPGIVLPELNALANEPYIHQYFTDGSPQVGDVCTGANCGTSSATAADWRTILVAGLNGGGRGYYALDITNPSVTGFKALWEFTYSNTCVTVDASGVPTGPGAGPFYADCHVGLSYGNPVITKRSSDGRWVVLLTSGYNNGVSHGAGDGQGYLYMLDAATGEILHRLSTGSGSAASPSGLAKISAWASNSNSDNTAIAVYGGDLDGNLWRFDLDYNNGSNANFLAATKIAQAVSAIGVPQPITVRPELGEYQGKRIVLFGTGKFLEAADKTGPFTANENTIYALLDNLGTGPGPLIADVRGGGILERTFSAGTLPGTRTTGTGSNPTWNGTDSFGWRIDLPDVGERVNVDPQLQLGTLVVASNVPNNDSCTAGGISYLNYLDYATGSYVQGANGNMASMNIGSSLTVGINVVMLPGGKVVTIATTAANQQLTQDTPVPPVVYEGRRVSWRELVVE